MKGMRDSKGPITSSALKKMMKKFEATGSLASRQEVNVPQQPLLLQRQWSKRCNPCRRLLHIGSAVLEKFRGRQECRTAVSESIANNSETVFLHVAT
ncbi:hypothetical protein CEXT_131181 [Caerostris extrusa]|uniref:DUF4817 domain-containing protein n=1 Tax=Caerostris extrusa TaxID=172846 RepID=A0AAV4TSG3_CAEEX|nr:hypothetical protein CEXT_131181 [Caerostris extrusa]